MALKIRLRQHGRRNRAFYRLVVTDVRAPRDGKYLEAVGWYNPLEANAEQSVSIDRDRMGYWLGVGAQLTDSAAHLVRRHAPEIAQHLMEKKLALLAKRATKRKEKQG